MPHLTLIEAHHHYEVLLRWIPLCVRTDWAVNVVSSLSNWRDLQECIPEDCSDCNFYDISKQRNFPKSDFVVFLSLQKDWHAWMSVARDHPSALIIHNANTYLRPQSAFAPREKTGFSSMKYGAKWLFEQVYRIHMRRNFLKAQQFVVPYSTTQIPFLQKYCQQTVAVLPSSFRQTLKSEKTPNVLIHLYNRIQRLDIPFFKKCLAKYQSSEFQQIDIICSRQEYQQLQLYFRQNEKVVFHEYPLSTSDYHDLVARSKYMCLPFHQESIFNIYTEFIGTTKYSGRIRDAIEFGCELHMPEDIPRESGELPSLEEAAERMDIKLKELYAKAQKG